MSLNKQLWLAILVLMLLAFISSFTISTMSARNYYQEQLQQKDEQIEQLQQQLDNVRSSLN